ncbi:two-component system sensor histidine kinase NtrB [Oceanidesulfovibrio indonesiensis]|nr:ATP-binding protein [Oceanidesulfovibrio indonesiensis]
MDESFKQIATQNIVEAMALGLMVVDHDGEVVLVNPALTTMLGFTEEELRNSSWGELFFSLEENYEFNDVLMEVIRFELVNFRRQVPYTNPRTNRQLMLSLVSSFLRQGKELTGVVLLVEDITEAHQRQQRERRLLWERNLLQRERADGLKNLALSVAHQVRNPIMTIAGFTQRLLKAETLNDNMRSKLEIIIEESNKLEKTVKTVADYASLERPQLDQLEVGVLINEIRSATRQKYGLEMNPENDNSIRDVCIAGDKGQLVRAVMHIVDNAMEFGCNEMSIKATANPDNGGVTISISDDGPGIAPDNLPYIFDPFYTTKPQAVGMGLTEARHIILDNQGDVSVESNPGQGATFHLHFPLALDSV